MPEKPTIFVSAIILSNDTGEILLAQRPKGKAFADFWEFPGGKIEKNEKAEDALIRELKEELDITINKKNISPLTFTTYEYDEIYLIMLVFSCNKWSGKILPLEKQQIKWIKINDIKNYKMLPADMPIVDLLLEKSGL